MSSNGSIDNTVSVLGLGAMGSVLARTLLRSGYSVTVWNRSPERGLALENEGALLALDPASAINASRLIIICMIDKLASETVLRSLHESVDLSGRTIINLSTGSVAEVERTASFVESRNGLYLDGGIMCYPKDIGARHTAILYSGSATAYQAHEQTLMVLAGNPKFLGPDPTTCAPTYLAMYAFYFGAFAAWLEGLVLASSAGLSIETFKQLSPIMTDMLVDGINTAADRITTTNYSGEQASVDVHVAGMEVVRQALQDAKAPYAATDAFLDYCRMAQDKGMGELDIASLFNAMHP
ncbi:NAD(P)-dependent oxidoreductase [Pseudomonas farris]